MDEKLSQTLEDIGFTEKEALVYLALMELGSGNVTDIAQRAKLKRSIIYILLEGLIKRGYVSEIPDTKINRYVAAEPTKILNELKDKTANFKSLLPSFLAMYNKPIWKPKINYFEGKEGLRKIYRYISQCKTGYFIYSNERIAEYLPEEVKYWVTGKLDKSSPLAAKHLLSNTKTDRDFAKNLKNTDHQFKFLPKILSLDMDISIYENKVAITSLGEHLFIVVIESRELYNSMKTLFELLWAQGIELKKLK